MIERQYDPRKDKGLAWGGKYRRTPSLPLGDFVRLYEKFVERNYWRPLPTDQRELAKAVLRPLVAAWKEHPDFEWWQKYFETMADALEDLVAEGKFVPTLGWLADRRTIQKYERGFYGTGGDK